jgi:predicted dehydrogenase
LVSMPVEDRYYSLYEFAESVKQKRQPETSGRDNIKSLAIVFGALESAKKNKEVSVKNFL